MQKFLWNITWLVLRPFGAVFCRFEIKGQENLKNLKKPVILAIATHSHWLDPYIVSAAMPFNCHLFPIGFMTKDTFFRIPIVKNIIKAYGAFPVVRGLGLYQSLQEAIALIGQKKIIGIFIEGKMSKKGELREEKPGAATLSIVTNAPVVPVALRGTHQIRNPLRLLFLQRKITVSFGQPIHWQSSKIFSNPNLPDKETISQLTKIISDKIKELYFA